MEGEGPIRREWGGYSLDVETVVNGTLARAASGERDLSIGNSGKVFRHGLWASAVVRVAYVLLIVIAWWILAAVFPAFAMLFSNPGAVGRAFFQQLHDEAFYSALKNSCVHVVCGVSLGTFLGVLFGTATAFKGFTGDMLSTVEAVFRAIPPLACIPFGIIAFGATSATAVFIVALGVLWTVAIATREAIANVPSDIFELARSLDYQRSVHRFCLFTLPAAVPGVFAGIKTAAGQGWTLVVAAELAGVSGLGQRLWQSAGMLASEEVMTFIGVIGLLNFFSESALRYVDRRLFSWRV